MPLPAPGVPRHMLGGGLRRLITPGPPLLAPPSAASTSCSRVAAASTSTARGAPPTAAHRRGRTVRAAAAPATASPPPPGLTVQSDRVVFEAAEPCYTVKVRYDAAGGPLAGAAAVYLHAGHSGWQDTVDVALSRGGEDGAAEVWRGALSIPVSRLAAPGHLEIQAAFRAIRPGGGEAWDAAEGGRNYTLQVELDGAAPAGLAPARARSESRALVASLLTRLDALAATGDLPPPAAALLRTLAWQGDGPLLRAYERVRSAPDGVAAAALGGRCGLAAARPGLHSLHVASEMAPFAKVGGLADVVTALARAHQAAGVLAEVVLPKYGSMDYSRLAELRHISTVRVPWRDAPGGAVPTAVWSCVTEGLPVYLLEPLAPLGSGPGLPPGPWSGTPPFWRGQLYGEGDDTARFLFFGCAVLAFLDWSGRAPDVVHLHDWQAAAVAPLLEVRRRGGAGAPAASHPPPPAVVLSLHNMAFQGRLSPEALSAAPGLDPLLNPAAAGVVDAMADAAGRAGPSGAVDANLLQAGIRFAHAVTTVSPTYAREVLGPDFGCGLERVLAGAAGDGKFCGVLNGIDTDAGGGPGGGSGFDPAADPALPAHFTAAQPWPGKDACKRALLAELGFAPDTPAVPPPADDGGAPNPAPPQLFDDGAGGAHPGGRPLVAIVSRLSAQKGLDLMDAMVDEAISRGARVVVLGTAPDPADAARFADLAGQAEHGQDARYRLFFSDGLARRIYAGADALLVPSRYEPCGLAQLIALRYGTIPIVRRTGGLADTVTDIADGGAPEAVRNGVVFDAAEPGAARRAVERALDAYRADGGAWWRGCLVPRAAAGDWSWARSAATYLDVYRRAVGVSGR